MRPKGEMWTVYKELEAWRQRQPQPVYDAAERVLMSLDFYLGNGPERIGIERIGRLGLAEDVELMRQARFGYP